MLHAKLKQDVKKCGRMQVPKRVHIAMRDVEGIHLKKQQGWKEIKRFGDLVEMEEPKWQRAVRAKATMLTKFKSGIKEMFTWKS